MSDPIIKVEGLGKKYIILHEQQAGNYTALRDVISNKAKAVIKKREQQPAKEEFWALKDVNFEIQKGDAVGIIGRNGAGKSTLLKILSRITEPSTGRIELNGRVASLLEVGTGFHPELTGKENIFLNGAILGMSQLEIKKKFDEIVDFSGVEKFLDTPVKRYSSGMYVRLAFAVAAHLEPEILVVDEVLAVGDAEFQKKCLGKMNEVSKKEGRTVLFVSHNMGAVSALCNKAILLKAGMVETTGTTAQVINKYFLHNQNEGFSFLVSQNDKKYGDDISELLSGYLTDDKTEKKGNFLIDEEIRIVINYKVKKSIDSYIVPNLRINNSEGECVFVCNAKVEKSIDSGEYEAVCVIPPNFLNNGVYFIMIASTTYFSSGYTINFSYEDALMFEVVDKFQNNPLRYNYVGPIPGYIRPDLDFYSRKIN
jgi:lipopolysaccharide transport system ATP-binding protein